MCLNEMLMVGVVGLSGIHLKVFLN